MYVSACMSFSLKERNIEERRVLVRSIKERFRRKLKQRKVVKLGKEGLKPYENQQIVK